MLRECAAGVVYFSIRGDGIRKRESNAASEAEFEGFVEQSFLLNTPTSVRVTVSTTAAATAPLAWPQPNPRQGPPVWPLLLALLAMGVAAWKQPRRRTG